MAIKEEVTFSRFCDSFSDTYKDNFTYSGKRGLYDYLVELSEDCGEDIELDTVALCCEYTEYENFVAVQKDYPDVENIEGLRDNTIVIELPDSDGLIIQQY